MYGKMIGGRLSIVTDRIKVENGWTTNPTEEDLKANGYKEIEYTKKPTYDKEEEKLVEVYTDGDKITVSYEKIALTDAEHNTIIQAEIVAEENKITPRRQREIDLKKEGALEFAETIENNIVALRRKFR